ncbi:hypothetical protein LTR37_003260 [Vermiconidia calcicola]|uniref:Uncharacterized protein n=1 Tax=Vermiconidia calcicola TaxID=1690605 RepID=A0ACC3NR36_9PEZI|nr:hypothetical protein LTR37_003260 [Vermiconidia calcicola]
MDPQTDSPLFKPPQEVRDMIYVEVLQTTVTFHYCQQPAPPLPGFLLTCKQAYQETVDLYYRNTTLLFTDMRYLYLRLPSIPQQRLALIPQVSIIMPREGVEWSFLWSDTKPEKELLEEWRRLLKESLAKKGTVLRPGVLKLFLTCSD